MRTWWPKVSTAQPAEDAGSAARRRYQSFRELLSLNNECLEVLASIQEDLQYAPATEELLAERTASVFEKTERVVGTLGDLTACHHHALAEAVRSQRREVETFLSASRSQSAPRLSAALSEVDLSSVSEAGNKAAFLGEVKNRLGLPVPDGHVITAEAYRGFCGTALWARVRDATHEADLGDVAALQEISSRLASAVLELPVHAALEAAMEQIARDLCAGGQGLALRSSAVGEGGEKTFAGQFLTLLNVAAGAALAGYKRVVASRFTERALCYRLSSGLSEVESPMAVLVMPTVAARASGILYTRNPSEPKGEALWITATRGLASGIGSGQSPADLFVLARGRRHRVLERRIAAKSEAVVAVAGGGLARRPLSDEEATSASLSPDELLLLADRGAAIERHFGHPQDVEWAFDEDGRLWILQSRPLAMAAPSTLRDKTPIGQHALLSGGRSIYPGRASGPACLVKEPRQLSATPEGAVLFLRRASPEIVEVFPRITGVVAEWGNLTGHAAALLREFRIPAAFQMAGAFERVSNGDLVSLDAAQARVYGGVLWPPREPSVRPRERLSEAARHPVAERLLALRLSDPSSLNFRAGRCRSTHDVLRFCHEKAIEAMFAANDSETERDTANSKRLLTPAPLNLRVVDLGGGLAAEAPAAPEVTPAQIRARPFQAFWRGVCHPGVSWTRPMPARLSDLASVMATSLAPQSGAARALGERGYLLVADEYMNLNSRLAFHFTLIDACVSDTPANNHVALRFAGGAAAPERRDLRARFLEACLVHYGYRVDRRGDLVNAWLKKAPAREMEAGLDVLGRLMACSSQLDMYMNSDSAMRWYVRQFLRGNYAFSPEEPATEADGPGSTGRRDA